MKGILIAGIILYAAFPATGQLVIGADGQISLDSAAQIILHNTGLINNGSFSAGKGKISFTGDSTAHIEGSQPISLYDLHIGLHKGISVILDRAISLSHRLGFDSGFLDLNGHNADLGSMGALSGEYNEGRVIGAHGGEILANTTLDSPSGAEPGGMGLVITAAANLGATTIRRGHQEQTGSSTTQHSIARYYSVSAANNTALNAAIQFHYFSGELDSANEQTLTLWQKLGSQQWSISGVSTKNPNLHYVTTTAVPAFGLLTLADADNPLPVNFLSFHAVCTTTGVTLSWTTASEQNSNYFAVQRSLDGSDWSVIATVPAAGTSANNQSYAVTDPSPINRAYYRIAEYDLDGRSQYSIAASSGCNPMGSFRIWPNPATDLVYCNVPFTGATTAAILRLIDTKGAILRQSPATLIQGNNLLTIDIHGIAAGMYYLTVQTAEATLGLGQVIKAR